MSPYVPQPNLYDSLRNKWAVVLAESPEMETLSIEGVDKATFLAALFNSSATVAGRGSAFNLMHRRQAAVILQDIQAEQARMEQAKLMLPLSLHLRIETEIENLWNIEFLDNRPIHVNLRRDIICSRSRDKWYGPGNTHFILSLVKTGLRPSHEVFQTLRLETFQG